MTSRHQDPEYARNARIVRKAVDADLRAGRLVQCIGCGGEIQPGQRYDVGHIIDGSRGGSNELSNLGPQHRRENRSAGGRLGATRTNTRTRSTRGLPTWI